MAEDLNRLKMISRRLVHAQFQMPYEFRLEIEGMPKTLADDFDLLVKDISYGPITIETEAIKVGGITLTYPTGSEPNTITMTIRDLKNRPFYRWFRDEWVPQVVRNNGLFNLPFQYVRKVTRISLTNPKDIEFWTMIPTKLGDLTETVEASGGFLEIPVTMVQFRSQGDTGSIDTEDFVEPAWAKKGA